MARSLSTQQNRRPGAGRRDAAGAYYVDGNTVRKAVPARRDASSERAWREAERRRREMENARRARAARQAAYADHAELSIGLPYLLMLVAAVLATLFICFGYLRLNASIDAHMDNIERLEARLENMKTENDALEQSIDTSVDLNYVYQVAVNELGMVHAGKDNIIGYDKTESEYVRQYENIPKK